MLEGRERDVAGTELQRVVRTGEVASLRKKFLGVFPCQLLDTVQLKI